MPTRYNPGVSSSVILGGAPLGLNADPNVWTAFRFTTPAGPNVSGGITLQIAAITGAVNGSVSNVTVDNVVVSVARAAASWSNYGAGWPGTGGGVPTLQLDANPVLGTTVNALIGNVSGGVAIGGVVEPEGGVDADEQFERGRPLHVAVVVRAE